MAVLVSFVLKRRHISDTFCSLQQLESYAHCSRYLARLSARKKLTLLAPDSRGRQYSSRIGFNVAASLNSNVFDFYFLVWSLSRLLCCVGSGYNVDAPLRPIHTYLAAPLPCSDSAAYFVKVRVVARNIRTASPTV
jgi:hypothetical protein